MFTENGFGRKALASIAPAGWGRVVWAASAGLAPLGAWAEQLIAESTGKDGKMDGAKFKTLFRKAHAEKLRQDYGIVVEAVTYDPPEAMGDKDALTSDGVARVIAELRARKRYLTHWLSLGPFDNRDGRGIRRDDIQPSAINKSRVAGEFGDAYWRRVQQNYLRLDLNQFYVRTDPANPNNPEHVCAYNYTTIRSAAAQSGFFELEGSDDWARAWLNRAPLPGQPVMLRSGAQRWPVELHEGANELLVKSCEDVGDWYLIARFTDAAGHDLPGRRQDRGPHFKIGVGRIGELPGLPGLVQEIL